MLIYNISGEHYYQYNVNNLCRNLNNTLLAREGAVSRALFKPIL